MYIPTNVKTTYFFKNGESIGRIDTAIIPNAIGGVCYYETMDFLTIAEEGTLIEEHTHDLADSVAIHDAWKTIIATRYNAKPIDTYFMGCPVAHDKETTKLIEEKIVKAEMNEIDKFIAELERNTVII